MKKILFPVCAAIIGYASGFFQSPDLPPGAVSAAVPTLLPLVVAPEDNAAKAVSGFLSRRDFREFAKIGALMEKMSPAQIGALIDRISRLRDDESAALLPMIVNAWTRRSPDDAFAWIEPKLAEAARDRIFGMGFPDVNIAILRAWANGDPVRAIEYAKEHHQSTLATKLLSDAIFALREKSDAEKFNLLRAFPDGEARDNAIKNLCHTWSYRNPAAALAAAESLPIGPAREQAVAEVLVRLATKDRKAALMKLATLVPRDERLELVLMQEFAKNSPEEAAAWIDKSDTAIGAASRGEVAARWAEKSPGDALNWAIANGVPINVMPRELAPSSEHSAYKGLDFSGLGAPLLSAFNRSPEATLKWLHSLPPGDDRDRYFAMIAERAQSPKSLAPFIADLPSDTAVGLAASITRSLPDKEAGEWAKSLSGELRAAAFRQLADRVSDFSIAETAADRDAMNDGIAYTQARNAPVKALEAVVKISDPRLRRQAFDDVMWAITRGDIMFTKNSYSPGPKESLRNEAREWLEKSDIPPDWKEPWKNKGP